MPDEYEETCQRQADFFRQLIALYYAGQISINVLHLRFAEALRDHLIRLWLLGRDRDNLTPTDMLVLERLYQIQLAYLAAFMADIITMSENRAGWRAALYAWNRPAYVVGQVPGEVILSLPVLPGEDCLGGNLCQCSWEIEEVGNAYHCYWTLGESEHCEVCIAHSIDWSPLVVSAI